MPSSLSPIYVGNQITDKNGGATLLLILRWQELINGFQRAPTIAAFDKTGQTAAIVTSQLAIPKSGGLYRVNYALTRTVDDGTSSSAQVTIGWTQNGLAKTEPETALTEASGLSFQGVSRPFWVDPNAPITIAVAYLSNTPNKMTYDLHAVVEQFS